MDPSMKKEKESPVADFIGNAGLIREKALIMSGYGINSEMETAEALLRAGMSSDIVHINDLIAGERCLSEYRLLVFPGGFSYGDDTGAGNAFANRIRNNLWDDVLEFLRVDTLVLGICNGFQPLILRIHVKLP